MEVVVVAVVGEVGGEEDVDEEEGGWDKKSMCMCVCVCIYLCKYVHFYMHPCV